MNRAAVKIDYKRLCTVAIYCALPIEFQAVMLCMENIYVPCTEPTLTSLSISVIGRIGKHCVLLVFINADGNFNAQNVGLNVSRDHPSIKHSMVVGIGGGIPSEDQDIRLGDIVVSMSTKFHRAVTHIATWRDQPWALGTQPKESNRINDVSLDLQNAARRTQTRTSRVYDRIEQLLETADRVYSDSYSRERTLYGHMISQWRPKNGKQHPFVRPTSEDILWCPCRKSTGCESCQNGRIVRYHRPSDDVDIHYGPVISGPTVVRDAKIRDYYGELGFLCFEMEAAGVAFSSPDTTPMVIKSISDYSDAVKNKDWQGYAALTAAAMAFEILHMLEPSPISKADPTIMLPVWCCDHPVPEPLIGLEELSKDLFTLATQADGPQLITLMGNSGSGKTFLARHLSHRLKNQTSVVWLQPSRVLSMMMSASDLMMSVDLEQSSNCKSRLREIVNTLVRIEMSQRTKWLVVMDRQPVDMVNSLLAAIRQHIVPVYITIITTETGPVIPMSDSAVFHLRPWEEEECVLAMKSMIRNRDLWSSQKALFALGRRLMGNPQLLCIAANLIQYTYISVEALVQHIHIYSEPMLLREKFHYMKSTVPYVTEEEPLIFGSNEQLWYCSALFGLVKSAIELSGIATSQIVGLLQQTRRLSGLPLGMVRFIMDVSDMSQAIFVMETLGLVYVSQHNCLMATSSINFAIDKICSKLPRVDPVLRSQPLNHGPKLAPGGWRIPELWRILGYMYRYSPDRPDMIRILQINNLIEQNGHFPDSAGILDFFETLLDSRELTGRTPELWLGLYAFIGAAFSTESQGQDVSLNGAFETINKFKESYTHLPKDTGMPVKLDRKWKKFADNEPGQLCANVVAEWQRVLKSEEWLKLEYRHETCAVFDRAIQSDQREALMITSP